LHSKLDVGFEDFVTQLCVVVVGPVGVAMSGLVVYTAWDAVPCVKELDCSVGVSSAMMYQKAELVVSVQNATSKYILFDTAISTKYAQHIDGNNLRISMIPIIFNFATSQSLVGCPYVYLRVGGD